MFQAEAGICWLNLLRDLRQVGRVTFNSDDDLDLFVNGEAAWLMDGTWNLERLRQELGDDRLAIDPWPVLSSTEAPLRGFVWTENVYLHPSGDVMKLEASWAFARFLMAPETQLSLADPQGAQHIPALAEVDLMEPYQVQAARALREGVGLPLVPNLDLYEQPLEGAMRSVAIQGASPERALTVAVVKIEQALAEIEAQP
jgi:ABC-type glycerol-3-phosphate transport system substrate-binding protein